MKDKSKNESVNGKIGQVGLEEEAFLSRFDSLGAYTGTNCVDGYEPEQDADDM